jgi:hypothetical protein
MEVTITGTGNIARGTAACGVASFGRAVREGSLVETSDAVESLTGRPPRSPREVFEAHRGELLQGVSA